MKNFFSFIITALLIAGTVVVVNGQASPCYFNTESQQWESVQGGPCVNTLITSVPFLRIVPDARSAGMGDAGIGISPDPNAMHFNASKLAFVEDKIAVSATYSPWLRSLGLQDVYLAYLSGYYKINDLQALGMSLRYFSLGDIDFTDANGTSLGTGRPNEFEISLAYARKLSERFSAAITGKFIYSNLAAGQQVGDIEITAGTSGAVDISMTYVAPIQMGDIQSTLTSGLALTNIGAKISYTQSQYRDFLPANFGLGAAWDIDFDDFNRLTVAFDLNKLMVPTPKHDTDPEYDVDPEDGIADHRQKSLFAGVFGSFADAPNGFSEEMQELMFSWGLEYWYNQQFAVRAGYYYENPYKGNRQYITAGLGLKYNIFGLNISYLIPTSNQRSPLDNTLRFSIIFSFENNAEEAPPSDQ